MPAAIAESALLNERQAAELLGVAPQTLTVWRLRKSYPLPYVKLGRVIRYRLSDIETFIRGRLVNGVS